MQDDRRALLSLYSQNQLQFAALAIALFAAFAAEVDLAFGTALASSAGLPEVVFRGMFGVLVWPTLFAATIFGNDYLVSQRAVRIVIREILPETVGALRENLRASKTWLDPSKLESYDVITLLDAYFSREVQGELSYWNPLNFLVREFPIEDYGPFWIIFILLFPASIVLYAAAGI